MKYPMCGGLSITAEPIRTRRSVREVKVTLSKRMNCPNLSEPPSYSPVVVSSGSRLVPPGDAVPLDKEDASWGRATTEPSQGQRSAIQGRFWRWSVCFYSYKRVTLG